jgi:hypothetical protein
MDQDRRSFLATVGVATIGFATTRSLFAELRSDSARAKLSRIGLEMYTVRREAAADLAGTLARIAKIGYKEVEFAGYYNHPATEVRDLLGHNGLTARGAHRDYRDPNRAGQDVRGCEDDRTRMDRRAVAPVGQARDGG